MKTNRVFTGDSLEVYKELEPSCADLILTDPPYGNVNGMELDGWGKDTTTWDNSINPKTFFELADHLLRKRGKLVSFTMEPYTSKLITSTIANVKFSYKLIWEKDHFANSFNAQEAPLNYYEELAVFTKQYDSNLNNPVRQYFKAVKEYIGLGINGINERLGHRKAEHSFYIDTSQFALCTEETYNELIDEFGIDEMDGFKTYNELDEINESFKQSRPNVFNLQEGEKHKPNILKYDKAYGDHHPTQKPVPLLEDLIKTYTNPGDLVIDPFAGSGSTAVAAKNVGRDYIAIEQRKQYANVAQERLNQMGLKEYQ